MLTPERRAELRESVNQETNLEAVYRKVGGATLAVLLDAADELDRLAAVIPCDERYSGPYDFAYCEAHDRTFALGSHCDHAGLSEVDYLGEREQGQRVRAIRAEDERDRLAAAVERVRALHERDGEGFCVACDYMTPHPCPTLRTLDGTDGPQ